MDNYREKTSEEEKEIGQEITEKWFPKKETPSAKIERQELSEKEKKEKEDIIKKEIEEIKSQEGTETEILEETEKIKRKNAKEKIEYLLNLAKDKGIYYSVNIAKKDGDAYIIDLFHDILVKEGLFKKFSK